MLTCIVNELWEAPQKTVKKLLAIVLDACEDISDNDVYDSDKDEDFSNEDENSSDKDEDESDKDEDASDRGEDD